MKFLLIDDHVLIREALRGVLKELRRDAAVLEAANCRQAKRLVEEHSDLESYSAGLELAGWVPAWFVPRRAQRREQP
jgi:hypothetical protein